MAKAEDRPRCTAKTAKGTPCKNARLPGQAVCFAHSGSEKLGRPSGLTPEVHAAIVDALGAGAYAEDASRGAGVHPATYHRWMAEGEADAARGEESDLRDFYEAASRAKASARLAAVAYVRKHMKDDWRAAAWYLERTMPDKFGRVDRLQHSGKIAGGGDADDVPALDLSQATDEDLDTLEELVDRLEQRAV